MTPAAVAAWLGTDEGKEWSRRTFRPAIPRRGPTRPYQQPVHALTVQGPLDPAHDPCGRPPLPECAR